MDILSEIMKGDPDWEKLPEDTPLRIRELLESCLEKHPRRRPREIGEALRSLRRLESGAGDVSGVTLEVAPASRGRGPVLVIAALICVVAVMSVVIWDLANDAVLPGDAVASKQVQRFDMALDSDKRMNVYGGFITLSRDGKRMAYAAEDGTIFARHIGEEFRQIAGGDNYQDPFFSPDGDWIGFDDANAIYVARFLGGSGRKITIEQGAYGQGIWTEDDEIIFDGFLEGQPGLYAVSAQTGESREIAVVRHEDGEAMFRRPGLLPGGEYVVLSVQVQGSRDDWPIITIDVETGERKDLGITGIYPRYSASGHLLYVQNRKLWAAAFDLDTLSIIGQPVPVVEHLGLGAAGRASYALSDTGTLAYAEEGDPVLRHPAWVDRDGNMTMLPVEPAQFVMPRLSSDGTKLATGIGEPGITGIFLMEVDSARAPVPLSPVQSSIIMPVWTNDDANVIYSDSQFRKFFSVRGDFSTSEPVDLFQGRDLGGTEFIQIRSGSVSGDGKNLIFSALSTDEATWDIWQLEIEGDTPPVRLVSTSSAEFQPRLSSDDRWLAYATDISGEFEIRVLPYLEASEGSPTLISTRGGLDPVWSRDSSELFYLEDDRLMSVAVPEEGSDRWPEPKRLIDLPNSVFSLSSNGYQSYDVAPDGERFLFLVRTQGDEQDPDKLRLGERYVLIQNWFEELKRLAPLPEGE